MLLTELIFLQITNSLLKSNSFLRNNAFNLQQENLCYALLVYSLLVHFIYL